LPKKRNTGKTEKQGHKQEKTEIKPPARVEQDHRATLSFQRERTRGKEEETVDDPAKRDRGVGGGEPRTVTLGGREPGSCRKMESKKQVW